MWRLFGDPGLEGCEIAKRSNEPFGFTVDRTVAEHGLGEVTLTSFAPPPTAPWTMLEPPISMSVSKIISKSDFTHEIRAAALEMIDRNYKHSLQIFTDGSKDPNSGKVSAAFSVPSLKVKSKFRITDNTSIFTAELIGILRAMSWILEIKPMNTVIFTDSLSSLKAIQNFRSKTRPGLIWEIWHTYNNAARQGLDIKLEWVPAHVGIYGNEMADGLAKAALRHESVDVRIGLSPAEVYSLIRPKIIRKWQKSIENNANFRHSYTNTSANLKDPEIYSNIQKIDSCITRLRLGYTKLPASLGFYYKIYPSKLCDHCHIPETAEHWITVCGKWGAERAKLRSALTSAGLQFTMSSALRPPIAKHGVVFRALSMFIMDCRAGDGI